ncbi:hypothetical protein [Roseibium sp.]|uniref:hypothetical protein n=1 Tax=Roseibium sp. TaxID=1936156 RepID=UPI003BB05402
MRLPRTKFTRLSALLVATNVASLAAPAGADDWTYMDNRSSPQKLVESYYAAISQQSYAQA